MTKSAILLVSLLALVAPSCWCFQYPQNRLAFRPSVLLWSSSSDDDEDIISAAVNGDNNMAAAQNKNWFPNQEVEMLDFSLQDHKPLGCTVEESLAKEEDDKTHHVFVAKLVEGGSAEKAGLRVGDVITGVTGTFGEIMPVAGTGLEHVKSLVSACPKKDTLEISVARGTDVMERHETALVDLCTLGPGSTNDKEVDNCVQTIHSMAYSDLDDDDDDDDSSEECIEEDGSERMLESMFVMWAEDLPEGSTQTKSSSSEEEPQPINGDSKPAPWSSRSSPSGTYVRDPTTGEMRNIG